MKKFNAILVLIIMIFTVGCAKWSEMTPLEKSQSVGYEMAKTYQDLYKQYNVVNNTLISAGKEMPEEVADSMNKLKDLIIKYNQIVIAWHDGESIEDIDSLNTIEKKIAQLIAYIYSKLNGVTNE